MLVSVPFLLYFFFFFLFFSHLGGKYEYTMIRTKASVLLFSWTPQLTQLFYDAFKFNLFIVHSVTVTIFQGHSYIKQLQKFRVVYFVLIWSHADCISVKGLELFMHIVFLLTLLHTREITTALSSSVGTYELVESKSKYYLFVLKSNFMYEKHGDRRFLTSFNSYAWG